MKTTHLSESEFVDLAEDTLDPRRAAHADTCGSCREQADALRAMLRDAASVDVPEPSPLFWDHLSARVRDEVAAEPAAGGSGWIGRGMRGLVPLAAMAALVVAVVSGVLLVRAVGPVHTPSQVIERAVATPAAPVLDRRPDTTPDAENAEVWAMLTAAASGVEFEEAHAAGMHVHPAVIDHAVQNLSAAELTELGRLLQSELKRSLN
jgi:hypothetical protein